MKLISDLTLYFCRDAFIQSTDTDESEEVGGVTRIDEQGPYDGQEKLQKFHSVARQGTRPQAGKVSQAPLILYLTFTFHQQTIQRSPPKSGNGPET